VNHHPGDSKTAAFCDRLAEIFFRHLDCSRRGLVVIAGPEPTLGFRPVCTLQDLTDHESFKLAGSVGDFFVV
jgi:hypothetical protein